jgi:uncharacterized protein (TIGR00255 family)
MTRSMTAFASSASQQGWGNIGWEIRSVNNRFFDCNFKLPELFKSLEMELRDILRQKIQRGRVECSMQYRPAANVNNNINLNVPLIKELARACEEVKQYMPVVEGINPLHILGWPDVLQSQEKDFSAIRETVITLFTSTVDALIENRLREGAALVKLLEAKLKIIDSAVQKIKGRFPDIIPLQRSRLTGKLQELQTAVNHERLEQEIVLFAQRIDICEEIDRLETHITEMRNAFKHRDAIGKRLDFLLQEFHRETNTITAKSVDAEITKTAIDMKVSIEQMREQVQNIE